jgi:hypothetical protein
MKVMRRDEMNVSVAMAAVREYWKDGMHWPHINWDKGRMIKLIIIFKLFNLFSKDFESHLYLACQDQT